MSLHEKLFMMLSGIFAAEGEGLANFISPRRNCIYRFVKKKLTQKIEIF